MHLAAGLVDRLERRAGQLELAAGLQRDVAALLGERDQPARSRAPAPSRSGRQPVEQRPDAVRAVIGQRAQVVAGEAELLVLGADPPRRARLAALLEILDQLALAGDRLALAARWCRHALPFPAAPAAGWADSAPSPRNPPPAGTRGIALEVCRIFRCADLLWLPRRLGRGGMERFRACFAELADPRTGNAQRHELLEILLIALCATLCGAESCVDMALFGRAKEPFLRRFLRLPGGVPSHDTFSRLFRLLDPVGVRGLLRPLRGGLRAPGSSRWWRSTARRRGARSTGGAGSAPLHLVSAWACEQRLVLGQRGSTAKQRDHGRARAAGPAGARGPHRHRRRDALPEGHGSGDPRPRRRLCAGAQSQPAGAARRMSACSSTIRRRRRRGRRDHRRRPRPDRDPPRRDRPRRRLARRGARLAGPRRRSARSPPRARSTARPRPPPATICCPAARRRALQRDRARPLADREPAALGARRGHGRGPVRAPARTTRPRTSPACAASPSTSCAPTPTKAPPAARSSAPAGTTPSSSNPPGGLMRLPCRTSRRHATRTLMATLALTS